MLTCEQFTQRWHDGLDDGRDAASDAAMADHLKSCADCRAFHAEMSAITASLDRLAVAPMTATVEAPKAGRLVRFAPVLAVAAAVALFIGATWIFRSPSMPAPVAGTTPALVAADITLKGESAERYLAVAQPSSNPRVRVYWLYDTKPGVAIGDTAESTPAKNEPTSQPQGDKT